VTEYEKCLIHPDKWDLLYDKMPKRVQEEVDELRVHPQCIGIGYCNEIGWFISCSGQGPGLLWQQKSEGVIDENYYLPTKEKS